MSTHNSKFSNFGFIRVVAAMTSLVALVVLSAPLFSDPCGMVPPIYTGPGTPITRTGLQQTYVFFDDGIESFVIRPGFKGKVDNFGMLIPFPSAPALRKVPDNVFEQIAAAVDPPEVVIDLFPRVMEAGMGGAAPSVGGGGGMVIRKNRVAVLKEEAVGMYEVAVLEAGSAEALKLWMDKNKYQYPKGMDKVTGEYIEQGWCFVAVKTKVAEKSTSDPKPGQRKARPEMPAGGVFDGNVQGLGFRFKTDELVVPMRLSAFNDGEMRNIVYLLSKGGKRIRAIPEEYVMRQVDGKQLVHNLTKPLEVRIIGEPGRKLTIPEWRQKNLPIERNPEPHNGIAKQIFVSDVVAKNATDLSHAHEETEKELLRIGEHFGLRGVNIDKEIESVSRELAAQMVKDAIPKLEEFTLTVVDGDFPREVLANQNLKFSAYRMAGNRNKQELYDTKQHAPGGKKRGKLMSHIFDAPDFKPGRLEFLFAAASPGNPESTDDNYTVTCLRNGESASKVEAAATGTWLKRCLAVMVGCMLIGFIVPALKRS